MGKNSATNARIDQEFLNNMVKNAINRVGLAALVLSFAFSCSVAEPKANAKTTDTTAKTNAVAAEPKGATIAIDPNGPADTVRVFYSKLREKKFREALFLTNLKPAIESLTEAELAEFSIDFAAIASQVPAEVQINGEIITGEKATVTANLPNVDTEKFEIQTINLRRENGIWVILTVDEAAEAKIKQDGKNYFNNLRIEIHEQEAKEMLERISKAQLASTYTNGVCAEIPALIEAGLLANDVLTSESTGYNYVVKLTSDKKRYFATATPEEYGKSGKRSFLLELDSKGLSRVTSKDNGGKPMKD